jgi:hypothetical protein
MRFAASLALIGIVVSSAALAADPMPDKQITPDENNATAPRLTVAQPITPPDNRHAPVLQSVSARTYVRERNGNIDDIVPDFHFIAPNGNAIVLHRELVDTSGAISQTDLRDATISIPAGAQKNGAVVSGGWKCGTQVYYVTIRAFIMDADGNRSNPVEYTIHCNGG